MISKQLLTGRDGETHDLGRWSWVMSTLSVLAAEIWNACHDKTIDILAFAQAISVLVAAHGGALWAKKDTEPEEKT